ncbi:Nischarin [Hypsibius exemplaris]|uniref:Nischarin n=1 Tax=Hypsibius exemplaris TaxID=2072580 RepID=A0A1W0X9C3_HYPEX|nr:Nischarin [Hypsibius exemplaris]
MAFVDRRRPENVNISQILRINLFALDNGHIYYEIQVTLSQFYWTIKRRYSEFKELHDKLVAENKVENGLLPAKHVFGVKNEAFLKKRQVDLEVYLLRLWHHLRWFPTAFAEFLDFHIYEIHFVTEDLCKKFALNDDPQKAGREDFVFTPLQIYAVNKRLQLPEPNHEPQDKSRDFGHLLDYIYRLKIVRILGSDSLLGASNIVENQLPVDLMIFKSAEELVLDQLRPAMLSGLENVRLTVRKLKIHRTLQSLSVFFLRDADGWFVDSDFPACLYWNKLVSADLSSNRIEKIDSSIRLLDRVEHLDLSCNQLRTIDHLHHLHNLQKLVLAKNYLSDLDALHAKLGNVQKIILCHNQLQSLKGLAKLYSLEYLDVSDNEVSSIGEVEHLRSLPCLTNISLTSNPITLVVDYRIKILACFGVRANEVSLDGTPGSAQEISHVNILLAIRKAQSGGAAPLRKRPTSEMMYNGSPSSGAASPRPGGAASFS